MEKPLCKFCGKRHWPREGCAVLDARSVPPKRVARRSADAGRVNVDEAPEAVRPEVVLDVKPETLIKRKWRAKNRERDRKNQREYMRRRREFGRRSIQDAHGSEAPPDEPTDA